MDLKGKAAIVTGGNSGIGAAIAEALAARGSNVVIAGRRQSENERIASELRDRHGVEAIAQQIDVSQEDACLELVRGAKRRLGRLDILVNNAGKGGDGKRIVDSSTEALESTLRVNLFSAYWCSREAFRIMSDNAQESEYATRGSIINISSVSGIDAWAETGIYSISKHGMMALTKSMAVEGAELGIRVAAVCPGLVATPMTGVSGPDYILPEDIAATTLYLLGLGAAAWPTEVVVKRRGAL